MTLPAWVEPYIGLPYIKVERDCWALYALALRQETGHVLPPYEGPPWTDKTNRMGVAQAAEAYAAQFEKVEPGREEPYDAILFRMYGVPVHVGMVADPADGWMLHIEEGCDAVAERYRDDMLWSRRIVGFYRFRG